MKNKLNLLFPLAVVMLMTLGCSLIDQIKKKADPPKPPRTVTARDGKAELTIPADWREMNNLNPEAGLQAGNPAAEQYAIVISEGKNTFADDMTLADFSDSVQENIKTALTDPVISETKKLTINGYPARQFEVAGSMQKVNARWIYTLVDAPKNYHQIMAWTLDSRYDQNKPVLMDVAASFKESSGVPKPAEATDKKP